jgi:hypothetical protein
MQITAIKITVPVYSLGYVIACAIRQGSKYLIAEHSKPEREYSSYVHLLTVIVFDKWLDIYPTSVEQDDDFKIERLVIHEENWDDDEDDE